MNKIKSKHIILVHIIVWIIILIFPLVSSVLVRTKIEIIDLLVHAFDTFGKIAIFYLNILYLVSFLFKKEYFRYFVISAFLIIIISIIQFVINGYFITEIFNNTHEFQPYKIFLALFSNFLVLGVSSAYALIGKVYIDEKKLQNAEKLQISTELTMLKNQIQPHFFFNTLNNIHYLIESDTQKAQDSIVELSKLMRYLLYETSEKLVSLNDEIKFLKHYISLMKMRMPNNMLLKFNYPKDTKQQMVPPLLIIMLIENAFKHCDINANNAFIECDILLKEKATTVLIKNNYKSKITKESGLGLTNLQQRLNLIYGDNYSLDVDDKDNIYEIKLILNNER